jgi:predicted AAA+ superfamily ATPase
LGFLNLARGLADEARLSGSIFENACFLQLYRPSALEPVRYWRSMAGAEVDFVVSTFKGLLPIEVKSQPPGKTLGRGLISFIQKYCPGQVIIATPTAKQNLVRFTTPISYIPYHLLSDLV